MENIGITDSQDGRKPDAPTIGSATGGNAEATVNFTAPSFLGKGTETYTYTVTSNPGSITGTGSSSPVTVTGLSNGTEYTFTVNVSNGTLTSDSSAASNAVTPVAPPFFPPFFPSFGPFFPPFFPFFPRFVAPMPPSFSDERDKTNIEALTLGLDFVNKLNPTTYTWNMRDGSLVDVDDFGFLAQDLVALEDSVDGHERLRLTHRENPDKLMISQDRLIPILVKAIQDLSKQIEDLKRQ